MSENQVVTGCEITPKEKEGQLLEKISLNDILGRGVPMYSGTLIINPPTRPLMAINCGDSEGFIRMTTKTPGIRGITWNETDIALILDDRHTIIRYSPELHPYSKLFFEKKDSRDDNDMRVWEGEYEPIQFTKQNLLKFLKLVDIADVPKDVIESIRNMKVSEKKTQEDTINLDEFGEKKVIEESATTNIPKRFSLLIPVSENFTGKFEFEATVQKKTSRYGNVENTNVIVLRCLNGRQVLRDRMTAILRHLPQEIPQYYGKMIVSGGNRDEHW